MVKGWKRIPKEEIAGALAGGGILGSAVLGLQVFGNPFGGLILAVPATIGLWEVVKHLEKRGHKVKKVERVGKKYRIHVTPKKTALKKLKKVM